MLENLSYECEWKGFTFEKFAEKHMECYLELARFNEPVLDTKTVRDFLNCIKAPDLAAAKQQVKATPNLATSLEAAVTFISLSVTPIKQLSRNVAGIESGNGRGGRHGGRVHEGRAFLHGGRDGQGCGRGRSRGQGRSNGRGRGRYTPYTGYYTVEECQSLSSAQHARVNEACSTQESENGATGS